jgi:hypothetical protein
MRDQAWKVAGLPAETFSLRSSSLYTAAAGPDSLIQLSEFAPGLQAPSSRKPTGNKDHANSKRH